MFYLENTKQYRVLEIFFRALRGEDISIQKLADEYGVSTKSVSRNISDLKAFLADNRELVGNTELEYSLELARYIFKFAPEDYRIERLNDVFYKTIKNLSIFC